MKSHPFARACTLGNYKFIYSVNYAQVAFRQHILKTDSKTIAVKFETLFYDFSSALLHHPDSFGMFEAFFQVPAHDLQVASLTLKSVLGFQISRWFLFVRWLRKRFVGNFRIFHWNVRAGHGKVCLAIVKSLYAGLEMLPTARIESVIENL